jgi:hypothetical protein
MKLQVRGRDERVMTRDVLDSNEAAAVWWTNQIEALRIHCQ